MIPLQLFNTALLTIETLAVCLPIGTALAWLVVRSDLPGRRLGGAVVVLLLFIPLYLQASAWQAGFGREGWYAAGGEPWLTGWNAALWVHILAGVPWVVLFVCMGLRTVEPELEEQALLDGSPGQVFRHVTLPAIWPAIGLAASWLAMLTAGEMTVTSLFTVRTYAEEVYSQIVSHEVFDDALANLMPGIAGSIVLLGLGVFCSMRLAKADRPLSLHRSLTFPLGHWRWPLGLGLALLLAVLFGVPLANLVYKAGVLVVQADDARVRTWSAEKCLKMIAFAPMECRRELGWSLGIGGLAATTAVGLAALVAWLARRSRGWTVLVLTLGPACLALPGPLLGLGIISLLNRPELPGAIWLYDRSILAPWLAMTVRALGPALLVLWYAVRTVPKEMLETAAVEGCGSLGTLFRVVLPQRLPALGVAWLIGLAVALAELTAVILVVPPGVEILSIRIFNWVHYGVEDQVAGICLALIFTFGAVATVTIGLTARAARQV